MRRIRLREYERSAPMPLGDDELRALRSLAPQVGIAPVPGLASTYELTPSSRVGLIRVKDTVFEIRPKLPIERLLFLLSYAVDPSAWDRKQVELGEADTVLEAIAPAFCSLLAQATYRGLLHGYRSVEEALPLVCGRVRFQEQIRRHFGLPLPVPVR